MAERNGNQLNSSRNRILSAIENSRYLFECQSGLSPVQFGSNAKAIVHAAIASLGDERARLSGSNDSSVDQILVMNGIYSRHVATPRLTHGLDSRPGQLIVFDGNTHEPYLLCFTRSGCELKRCRNGILESLLAPYPALAGNSIEVYPSFQATINSPLDILKLAYANNGSMIIVIILISVAVLCFGLSIPILSGNLVSHILPQGDMQGLIGTIFAMILIIVASIASRYVRALLILRLETSADLRLQTAVWDRFLKMPLDILSKYNLGELYVRLNSISRIRQQLNTRAITSFMSAVFSLAYLALMYIYDSTLASYVVFLVVGYLLLVVVLGRASIRLWVQLYDLKSSISSQSIEIANSSLSLRAMQSEPFLLDRWFQSFIETAKLGLRSDLYWQTISLLTQSLSTSGAVLFFSILIFRVFADPLVLRDPSLVGNFVAFYVAFISFNTSVTSAAITLVDRFSTVFALWSYCKDLLYNPISVGFDPDCFNKNLSGDVYLHEVELMDEDRKSTDEQCVSLRIDSGQLVCISAADDGRKASELLQAIAGFRSPASGFILFDGIHIEQLTHASMMEHLFYIDKNHDFYPDTLGEYLNPGNNYSDQELLGALEEFGLDDVLGHCCEKDNQRLIVDWSKLSVYQKKCLSLARASLSCPTILLVDSPFYELSEKEASEFQARLMTLSMTRIVASPFPEFVESSDAVVTL
jgi:ATP-binding cassette subfamily B protein